MDDYSMQSLVESKNEWVARLLDVLTGPMKDGLKAIFQEAEEIASENEEEDKYLMTFQTFLSRIPAWNAELVQKERKRIQASSSCPYLEDLITCVHVVQLKALACVRVGKKQHKVDIDLPDVDRFVHRAYTNAARKLYTCVYLFEKGLPPLQTQRNERELDQIVRESILAAVRDGVPVEDILKAYISQTEEIVETKAEEAIEKAVTPAVSPIPPPDVPDKPKPVAEILKSLAKADPQPAAPSSTPSHDAGPPPGPVIKLQDTPPPAPAPAIKLEVSEPPSPLPAIPSVPDPVITKPKTAPATEVTTLPPVIPSQPTIPKPDPKPAAVERSGSISFNPVDNAIDISGQVESLDRPKSDEALKERSEVLAAKEQDDEGLLKIGPSADFKMSNLVEDLNIGPGPIEVLS